MSEHASEIVGLHYYNGQYIVLAHVIRFYYVASNGDVSPNPTVELIVRLTGDASISIYDWSGHTEHIVEFLRAMHLYLETRT